MFLLGMCPEDLLAELPEGTELTSARRMIARVVADGGEPFGGKRPIPRTVTDVVRARGQWNRPRVVERAESKVDGFVKYLLEYDDGSFAEAVRIPLEKEGCFSVCLSSQVGCAMACAFCATGKLGLARNLKAHEIVAAFLVVREDLDEDQRITGAVFMGQGEPFHNYDEVIQAAKVLSDPCGGQISQKAITISTVGLVPKIRRFTDEGHKFRLIVSLTSADDDRRKTLLPIAGERWPIAELKDALKAHAEKTNEAVTVAWVLMGGVNDSAKEVETLRARFAGVPLRLNLIDVNSSEFRRSTDDERSRFLDALQRAQIPFVRRYSGGSDKDAACGMLANTRHVASDE